MQGDGNVRFFAQHAIPFEVVFEHRVFKDRYGAEGFEFAGETCRVGQKGEFGIGVDADRVVGAGGLFHQSYGLDDIPRPRLEFVVGKTEASADSGLGCCFVRFHMAGPIGHRHLVADLGTEEAVQWDAISLACDIEQGTGEGVGQGIGIQGQRVFADEGGGLRLAGGFSTLIFAPTFEAFIGLYAAKGDIVDLGKVAGDGRDRGDFDFVEFDVGYFHRVSPSAVRILRGAGSEATMIPQS